MCFHESTEIVYDRTLKLTLAALESDPSLKSTCVVPHVVTASGVAVHTTCSTMPLRLTNDHLVFTSSGLRTYVLTAHAILRWCSLIAYGSAVSLQKGDVLYGDMDEKQLCTVTGVTGEHNQRYFGLNCAQSEVLANGTKTSTFGRHHNIPAAWMRTATKIMSIQHAAQIGDGLVNLLTKLGLY